MKKQRSESNTYPTPVLKVAFRNLAGPAILLQIPEINAKNEGSAVKETSEKAKIPEFYQHHINPKRFDFL